MAFNWRMGMRKGHRWAAILIAIPFLLVLMTGVLLQLKKDWWWVQPPTKRGESKTPSISMEQILESSKSIPEAEIRSWSDIERIDMQPRRGVIKVTSLNRWEVQVDASSGKVLQAAYRRSDLIESLHDGSWFGNFVKLFVFLPVAVMVLFLWVTGIYLYFLPILVRWRRKRV